jgi:hypothetical protein
MFKIGKARPVGRCCLFRRVPALLLLGATGLLCSAQLTAASNPAEQATVIVVVGAPGEEEYAGKFSEWTELLGKAARQGSAREIVIGVKTNEPATDLERLRKTLLDEPKEGAAELWLVLIGHGTFDGKEAKFNLRSNDVSLVELANLLQPFRRPVAVINAASASGPFLNKLSGTNRVVITATRSGSEINYTRFGQYFSKAIADPEADLDKDGQTSLLEAFLMASRLVKEFYDSEGRLATEHSLLDDTGDGLGTPPDWFRGTRAVKSAKDGALLDGFRAHQLHLVRSEAEMKLAPDVRARRDLLEVAIAKLREAKRTLPEEEYYRKLEALLLEVARLYETAEKMP